MPDDNETTPKKPAKKPAKKSAAKKPAALETPADPFAAAPRIQISGDYYFEPGEKQALGLKLAGFYTQREEILSHKKDLMAQINAQAAGVDAEIKGTVNKIRSGFEPRQMEAFVLFNNPNKGSKSLYRTDTRALIRTELMVGSDYEQELPMEGLPPKAEAPEKPAKNRAKHTATVPPGGDTGQGTTSLADALNAAAVGMPLDPVPFDIDPNDEPKDIAKKFAKAAVKAKWPLPAVAILRDEVKKCEVAHRAAETLAPHIVSTTAPPDAQEGEPEGSR